MILLHSSARSHPSQKEVRLVSCRSRKTARRDVLASLASSLALSGVGKATAGEKLSSTDVKTFVSAEGGFMFDYPETWAVAIDRASMRVPGTLAVAGDFPNAVTLNISRETLDQLSLPRSFTRSQLQSEDGRRQFIQGTEFCVATLPNIFEFSLVSSALRTGSDGRVYVDLEYTDSICKGEVIEGLKGRRRCVDAFDNTISTPTKHAFRTMAMGGDGFVYSATASTFDSRWPTYGASLRAAAQSLQVA